MSICPWKWAYPEGLKETVIVLLLKKTFRSFRFGELPPVSSLSLLGNISKTVEAKQIHGFLDDTSALDPFRSGIHFGFGTETVLVTSCGHILCWQLDQGGFLRIAIQLQICIAILGNQ